MKDELEAKVAKRLEGAEKAPEVRADKTSAVLSKEQLLTPLIELDPDSGDEALTEAQVKMDNDSYRGLQGLRSVELELRAAAMELQEQRAAAESQAIDLLK